jgi:class 3 adenylate cyclase
MALKEDLEAAVKEIFHDAWDSRVGRVVPTPADLGLGNDAVTLDATVLYADISDSTKLVDTANPHFAAEVYRTYLTCAARIVKANDGVITAYDGDRIMGVFIGDQKNSNAVKAAMQINSAVLNIINPALSLQYPSSTYRLRHVVGIDTSALFVARIGVRHDNDLVWVGRAANYAAKLASINEDNAIFITTEVYNKLPSNRKLGGTNNTPMWMARKWSQMSDLDIYSSNWTWNV